MRIREDLGMLMLFILILAMWLAFMALVTAKVQTVIASGLLTATQAEDEEGYYAVGQGLVLMVRKGTVFHQRMQELKRGGEQRVVEVMVRVVD